MICQVKRDSNNTIQEVLTSTGKVSKTYPMLAKEYGVEEGLLSYMLSYTDDFKSYTLGDSPYKEHIMNNDLLKYPDNNILDLSRAKKYNNKQLLESSVTNLGFIPDGDFNTFSFDRMLSIAAMSNEKVNIYDSLVDSNIYDDLVKIKLNDDGEYNYKNIKQFVDNSYLNNRSTFADLDSIVPNTDYINSRNMGLSHEESLAVMRTNAVTYNDQLGTDNQDVIQTAREVVKNLFGANAPVIAGFNQLSKNLSEGSLPAGMLFDNIIYLNTSRNANIPNTTVYHEAFHHVFRYLLTDKQAQYYLDTAFANISSKELDTRVESLRNEYAAKNITISELELRDLALEEYMADQYEDYALRNKPATNWLVALFRLIKNMFLSIVGNRPTLESLYSKINNRGFRMTRVRDNKTKSKMPVFKLLTFASGKDKFQATADETQSIINTLAGKLINRYRDNSQTSFTKSDVYQLMSETKTHYAKLARSYKSTNTQVSERAARKSSIYDPAVSSNDGVKNIDIVYAGVENIFKALNVKIEEEAEEIDDSAQEEMRSSEEFRFDKEASEQDPMDIADDMFKKYISTTLYPEVDDIYWGLGLPLDNSMYVEKPIEVDNVFKTVLRSTASKDMSEAEMLNTIKALTYNNVQLEAFYNRIKEDITKQPNIAKLVFNAFNLEKVSVAQVLADPDHQSANVFDAITNKVEDPTMDSWKTNFDSLELESKTNEEFDDLKNGLTQVKSFLSGNVPVGTDGRTSRTREQMLDDVNQDGVVRIIKEALYNALGMELHSNTIRFMILDSYHGSEFTNQFTEADWNFYSIMKERVEKDLSVNENAKSDPYKFTEEFISYVNNSVLFSKDNVFNRLAGEDVSRRVTLREIRSPYAAKATSEVVGRMRNIAKLNTLFDQSRVSISFQDAAGNMRYGFVAKSYLSSVFRWLRDAEYVKELFEENPALAHNYITRNKQVILTDLFTPTMIGDFRQTPNMIMDSYGKVVKTLSFEEKQAVNDLDGVTSKTLDFKTYSALLMALFSRRYLVDIPVKVGEETEMRQIEFAMYHHQTNEVKNTDHAIKLPTKLVVMKKGVPQLINYITMDKDNLPVLNAVNEMKDEFYKLFRQDFDGIYHETNKFIEHFTTYWNRTKEYDPVLVREWHVELGNLYRQREFLDESLPDYHEKLNVINNEINVVIDRIKSLEQELTPAESFYKDYHFKIGDDMLPVEDKDGNISLGRAYDLWLYKDNMSDTTKSKYITPFIKAAKAYINKYYQTVRDNNTQDHIEELNTLKRDLETKYEVFNSAEARNAVFNDMKAFLENEFSKFIVSLQNDNLIRVGQDGIIENISLPLASKLDEEEKAANKNAELKNLRKSLYEDYGRYSFNAQLLDFFYSDYMNNTSLRFLTDKNMKYRKDAVDAVKRAGSSQGSGKGGGNEELRFAMRQEPTAFTKAGVEVDQADGGAEMSSMTFEYLMNRQGRMTKSTYDIFTKVHMGVPITLEEKEELESINAIFSAQKTLLMDSTHLHKLAYMIVIPEFTSYIPKENEVDAEVLRKAIKAIRDEQFNIPMINVSDSELADNKARYDELNTRLREKMYAYEQLYLPKPGYEQMHNTRQMMFYQDIQGVLPPTASKLRTRIPSQSVMLSEIPNDVIHDYSYSVESIKGHLFIMQLEVPSGKRYITNLSQLLNLIDNEQNDNDVVEVAGETKRVSEVKEEYRKLLGQRAEVAVNEAISELGKLEDGKFIPDLELFRDKILKSVSASGGDETIMGFLKDLVDGNSKFKYNQNLSPIADKFQQLFLSHFSRGVLQQKVPGLKVSLLSGHGILKVVDANDRVIMDSELIANRDNYFNADGTLKDGYKKRRLKWSMGRDATSADITSAESLFSDNDDLMNSISSFLQKTKYRYAKIQDVRKSLNEFYEHLSDDVKFFLITNAYLNKDIEPRKSKGNSDDFIYSLDDFIYDTPVIDYKSMSDEEKSVMAQKRMIMVTKLNIWMQKMGVITQEEADEFVNDFDYKEESLLSSKFFNSFKTLMNNKRVPGRRVTQSYAEIMMPATNEPQYAVQNGQANAKGIIDQEAFNEINTMLGARIPTQDKHSVIYARIVDFMPAAMGDVAIFPVESMWLSGEDFDIDSKYFMRKEFYVDKRGNIRIHGNAQDDQKAFEDYLEYMTTFNNRVIHELEKLKEEDEFKARMTEFENRRNAIIEQGRLAFTNQLPASETAKQELQELLFATGIYSSDEVASIMSTVTDIKSINTLAANLTDPIMNNFMNKVSSVSGLLRNILSYEVTRDEKKTEKGGTTQLLDDLASFEALMFERNALTEELAETEAKRDRARTKKAVWQDKVDELNAKIDDISIKQNDILTRLFDVMRAKAINIKNNEVVQDEIGEEVLALRRIAKFHYDIRMEKRNKRFMAKLYGEGKAHALPGMKELRQEKHEYVSGLVPAILTKLGLPANPNEEFKHLNQMATNNRILELMMALYRNTSLTEIDLHAASLSKIQGDREGIEFGVANAVSLALTGSAKRAIPNYTTANGRIASKRSNKVGSRNIPIVAIANIVKANLSRYNVTVKDSFRINWDNTEIANFSKYISHDIQFMMNGQDVTISDLTREYRISDELATMLMAMTDNGKHGDADKLNWTFETFGVYCYLVSMGYGLNRVGLFSKQPIMAKYVALSNGKTSALVSKNDTAKNAGDVAKTLNDKLEKRRKELYEFILKQDPEFTPPNNIGSGKLDSVEMLEAMKLFRVFDYTSDEFLDGSSHDYSKDFTDGAQLKNLKKLYNALTISQSTVVHYNRLANGPAQSFQRVSAIIRLHQGLPKSFNDTKRITQSIKQFGADVVLKEKLGESFDGNVEDALEQASINIGELLQSYEGDNDTLKMIEMLNKIIQTSEHFVLDNTKTMSNIINTVDKSLRKSVSGRAQVIKNITSSLRSFTSIAALKQMYKKRGVPVPFDESLIYSHSDNTLLKQFNKLVALLHDNGVGNFKTANSFLNELKLNANVQVDSEFLQNSRNRVSVNLDLVIFDTRKKRNADYSNKLIDSYRELLAGSVLIKDKEQAKLVQDELRAFANTLFYYLVAKDGLQFKNNSFIRYIAPEQYHELSGLLDKIQEAAVNDQWESSEDIEGLSSLLGMSQDEYLNSFMFAYATNVSNLEPFRKVSFDVSNESDYGDMFGPDGGRTQDKLNDLKRDVRTVNTKIWEESALCKAFNTNPTLQATMHQFATKMEKELKEKALNIITTGNVIEQIQVTIRPDEEVLKKYSDEFYGILRANGIKGDVSFDGNTVKPGVLFHDYVRVIGFDVRTQLMRNTQSLFRNDNDDFAVPRFFQINREVERTDQGEPGFDGGDVRVDKHSNVYLLSSADNVRYDADEFMIADRFTFKRVPTLKLSFSPFLYSSAELQQVIISNLNKQKVAIVKDLNTLMLEANITNWDGDLDKAIGFLNKISTLTDTKKKVLTSRITEALSQRGYIDAMVKEVIASNFNSNVEVGGEAQQVESISDKAKRFFFGDQIPKLDSVLPDELLEKARVLESNILYSPTEAIPNLMVGESALIEQNGKVYKVTNNGNISANDLSNHVRSVNNINNLADITKYITNNYHGDSPFELKNNLIDINSSKRALVYSIRELTQDELVKPVQEGDVFKRSFDPAITAIRQLLFEKGINIPGTNAISELRKIQFSLLDPDTLFAITDSMFLTKVFTQMKSNKELIDFNKIRNYGVSTIITDGKSGAGKAAIEVSADRNIEVKGVADEGYKSAIDDTRLAKSSYDLGMENGKFILEVNNNEVDAIYNAGEIIVVAGDDSLQTELPELPRIITESSNKVILDQDDERINEYLKVKNDNDKLFKSGDNTILVTGFVEQDAVIRTSKPSRNKTSPDSIKLNTSNTTGLLSSELAKFVDSKGIGKHNKALKQKEYDRIVNTVTYHNNHKVSVLPVEGKPKTVLVSVEDIFDNLDYSPSTILDMFKCK